MSSAPLTYTPQPHGTPAGELDALARIYSLAVQKYRETKEGSPPTALDDAKKESKHVGARDIIPE